MTYSERDDGSGIESSRNRGNQDGSGTIDSGYPGSDRLYLAKNMSGPAGRIAGESVINDRTSRSVSESPFC